MEFDSGIWLETLTYAVTVTYTQNPGSLPYTQQRDELVIIKWSIIVGTHQL